MWNRQKYPYPLFPKPILFQREHPYFHITSSDFHPVPCLALHEHCLVPCCAVLILLVSQQNSKSCSNFQTHCLKKITILNCSSDYGVHMFLFRKLVASNVSIHPARVTPTALSCTCIAAPFSKRSQTSCKFRAALATTCQELSDIGNTSV